MKSNASADHPAVLVDRREALAVYDALPPRWRALVDSLPIPQEVSRVRVVLDTQGNAAGYAYLCDVFEARFPGWKRPGSEPEPLPRRGVQTVSERRAARFLKRMER